jgi:flagellin
MPSVINTNLASLLAQGSLNNAQGALATSVQRLSSGLRINSSKDDASGLAITQTMAGHIKALDQASLNTAQAINLAQTADTSMSTVQDILLRIQQLAVAGANGSLSQKQKSAIVTEVTSLNSQINSISAGTTYNGISLLGATNTLATASTLNSGAAAGTSAGVTSVSIAGASAGTYTFTAATGSLSAFNGTVTQTVALSNLSAGGSATYNFSSFGISFNIAATLASTAAEQATGVTGKIITVSQGTTPTLNFQIGGSATAAGDQMSIAGYNVGTATGGGTNMVLLGTLITGTNTTTQLAGLTGNNSALDSEWNTAFRSLQTRSSDSINEISTQRAILGASMNQLGYIQNNLTAQSANMQAARSTIADTNYSAETSNLTKGQILQQAATAMLAQANQMPNVILSLLK